MRYAWIKQHDKEFPIALMCKVLQVSDSGYYGRLKYKPSVARQRRQTIAQAAARFYFESQRIYGYRKIYEDLRQANIDCCRETVRRIMRQIGLYSRVKRKFVRTTDSNHNMAVAQNLLDRDFTAAAVNTKWAADITYISTEQGWLYLAAVMDLYSRRIIGWSMSENIDSDLVISALRMAILQRRPQTGLLHHSDRGSQYASEMFQDLLVDNGIVCSMSRKGDCYVEIFYNRHRRHASLGYVSPAEYEELNENERKQVA
jgi:putative transposase